MTAGQGTTSARGHALRILPNMNRFARGWRVACTAAGMVFPVLVTLGADLALAGDGTWTLKLEPMYVQPYGHDQHVLTVHELDLDSAPTLDRKTAVNLDTESGPAWRGGLQYSRGRWAWGVDFFWFVTSQSTADRTAAADGPGGTVDQIAFEVADRSYTSSGPNEVLYYSLREDNDLEMWTVDLHGTITVAETSNSALGLQLGVRLGDFDNDYRAVLGIQDVIGTRLDASSNYDLMMGPLVGLIGTIRSGKNEFEGYIGQSLIMGSAELSSEANDFTGSFDSPSYTGQQVFKAEQDVAIPITELRLRWAYGIGEHLSLGVGASASVWWDVPVPPGVVPGEGGEALHESTVVLFGLLGSLHWTF
jgi:hypothetical protein